MTELSGRGPLRVVLMPRRELPELASFELQVHGRRCTRCDGDAPLSWMARRGSGMLTESLVLTSSVSHAEAAELDDDAEVEWTLTAAVTPAPERLGGSIAAVATLAAIAVAFTVPVRSAHWLPSSSPELHFIAGSLLFVLAGVVTCTLAYLSLRGAARALARRMEEQPTPVMLERTDKLVALTTGIKRLGLDEAA